jgi:hypothetical protein
MIEEMDRPFDAFLTHTNAITVDASTRFCVLSLFVLTEWLKKMAMPSALLSHFFNNLLSQFLSAVKDVKLMFLLHRLPLPFCNKQRPPLLLLTANQRFRIKWQPKPIK